MFSMLRAAVSSAPEADSPADCETALTSSELASPNSRAAECASTARPAQGRTATKKRGAALPAGVPLSLPAQGGAEGERVYLLQNKRVAGRDEETASTSMADFHLVRREEGGGAPARGGGGGRQRRGRGGGGLPREQSLDDWVVVSPKKAPVEATE